MIFAIIMAILSFLTMKKNGVSTSKAALGALVAGTGSYYVATQTDWGKATLGSLDTMVSEALTPTAATSSGTPVMDPVTGEAVKTTTPTTSKTGDSIFTAADKWMNDNLGIVAAAGVGAAAGGSGLAMLGLGLLAVLLIAR